MQRNGFFNGTIGHDLMSDYKLGMDKTTREGGEGGAEGKVLFRPEGNVLLAGEYAKEIIISLISDIVRL